MVLHEQFDDRIELVQLDVLLFECLIEYFVHCLFTKLWKILDVQSFRGLPDQVIEKSSENNLIIKLLNSMEDLVSKLNLQLIILHHVEFCQEILDVILFFLIVSVKTRIFGNTLIDGSK